MSQLTSYRREIDGLRALAVLPVILFHAGFKTFSGGFVGVDVFFVISGYLITTVILSELKQDKFSIVNFYERRARRILPALFLIMLVCTIFAWFLLLPSDMKEFSQSLVAVSIFVSNILFWHDSGYFDTASELKPLLHTWSLAVEEQYYVLFPLFLMLFWKFGKRWVLFSLITIFVASLGLAEWFSYSKPAFAFYLLPTRGWEILIGALAAFYLSKNPRKEVDKNLSELCGWFGVILIFFSIFNYSDATPFPGFFALAPTLGTVLIILFATQRTSIGKLIGNKALVGIGLISYSAYLWHQPIFAFTRHAGLVEPSRPILATLSLLPLILAYFSWRYVEQPFRDKNKFSRFQIFTFSILGSVIFAIFGSMGHKTDGFKMRFNEISMLQPWDPPVKCHGAESIAKYKNPLDECLGTQANKAPGDLFLLGDSHVAQLTFPMEKISKERSVNLNFINTENEKDFPYQLWASKNFTTDKITDRIHEVADKGDFVIISFHRGHLNDERDVHIPLSTTIEENEKYHVFLTNMENRIQLFAEAGIKVILIKDTPLLFYTVNLEKCALENLKLLAKTNSCSITLEQDLHTRERQSNAFDFLASKFPDTITVIDPLPALYGGQDVFNPINSDGSYRMIDYNHLTKGESNKLIDLFRSKIQ